MILGGCILAAAVFGFLALLASDDQLGLALFLFLARCALLWPFISLVHWMWLHPLF